MEAATLRRLFARPEFWLACLLAWLLLSAGRSLGTPWARIALSEALHWGVGLGLTLTLGLTLRRAELGARLVTVLAGLLVLAGVWDGLQPGAGGLVGPYHDHQLYGSALLVLLPLPVALALSARVPAWRCGGLAVAGGGVVCLVLSETRSAWAGGLVALLVFASLWLFQSGQWSAVRWDARRLLVPLLLLVGAGGVFWMTADGGLRAPVAQRAGTLTALSTDSSLRIRLSDWRGAARLVAEHPLAGIGLGRYPARQSAWADGGRALGPDTRPSLSEEAHSFYLQTAAETGLIGLGLYAAALLTFAAQALRRLRQIRGRGADGRAALLIAALSMAAGQAVDALASPSWQFSETSLLFWGLLGLGLASLRQPEAEAVATPAHPSWRYAASGFAAVALAANLMPVGLLTPVEAYTRSSSLTYNELTIAQSSGCTADLCFSLIAHYSDGGSPNVTLDNDANGTISSYGCTKGAGFTTACVSSFGSGSSRNQLTVYQTEHNVQMKIVGRFSDNAYNGTKYTSVISHFSTNTLIVTPP